MSKKQQKIHQILSGKKSQFPMLKQSKMHLLSQDRKSNETNFILQSINKTGDFKELYEESLMRICILGMENDRMVSFTRFLISSLEEKESTIQKYQSILENKEMNLTEISKLGTANKKLQKEIEILNELLEEKNVENESFRKQMNQLQLEINKLQIFEQEKNGAEYQNTGMKSKIDQLTREWEELFSELQLLKQQNEHTSHESLNRIVDLKNQLQLLVVENDRLLQTLEDFRSENENLQEQVKQGQIDYEELGKDYDLLKHEYDELIQKLE